MTNEVALLSYDTLAALVIGGDLSKLNQQQKVEYYTQFCVRIGLDPATQPFKILKLQGKETLYAGRECAAQLCKLHKVSHQIVSRERADDLSIVTAKAMTPDGRCTESIGAVSIMGLKGEALANALMKAETKAKRRATLDLLGLGLLDETEADTIPGAVQVAVQTNIEVLENEQNPTENIIAIVKREAKDCETTEILKAYKDELFEKKGPWWTDETKAIIAERLKEIKAQAESEELNRQAMERAG